MPRRQRDKRSTKPLVVPPMSEARLRYLADLEDGCSFSVGGLAVRAGLYRSEPEPRPTDPSDRELLREAKAILRKMVDADTFPAMFQARVEAEVFLSLHGEGEGSPRGVLGDK